MDCDFGEHFSFLFHLRLLLCKFAPLFRFHFPAMMESGEPSTLQSGFESPADYSAFVRSGRSRSAHFIPSDYSVAFGRSFRAAPLSRADSSSSSVTFPSSSFGSFPFSRLCAEIIRVCRHRRRRRSRWLTRKALAGERTSAAASAEQLRRICARAKRTSFAATPFTIHRLIMVNLLQNILCRRAHPLTNGLCSSFACSFFPLARLSAHSQWESTGCDAD